MDKKTARQFVDDFKSHKQHDKDQFIELSVGDYLSQIKFLAQQGIAELQFNPPRHVNEIKKRIEKLGFTIEQRGTGKNKTSFIIW